MFGASGGDHSNAGRAMLEGILRGPAYMTDPRRACAEPDVDPDWFYTEDDHNKARRVCGRCMFKNQCHAYAAENHILWGVWGGKNRNPRLSRRQGE